MQIPVHPARQTTQLGELQPIRFITGQGGGIKRYSEERGVVAASSVSRRPHPPKLLWDLTQHTSHNIHDWCSSVRRKTHDVLRGSILKMLDWVGLLKLLMQLKTSKRRTGMRRSQASRKRDHVAQLTQLLF